MAETSSTTDIPVLSALATPGSSSESAGQPNVDGVKLEATTEAPERPAIERIFHILPVEMLLEIFSWLRPFDLLALIETNHQLRSILTRRSSKSVWSLARRNIRFEKQPPDPPSYLSEIQYARTIYDASCSNCLRHTTDIGYLGGALVDYSRFKRVCYHCRFDLYIHGSSDSIASSIPYGCNMQDFFQSLEHVALASPGGISGKLFLQEDINLFLPIISQLWKDVLDGKEDAEAARDEYLAAAQARNQPIRDFAQVCMDWNEGDKPSLGDIIYKMENQREAALHQMIVNRGHDAEDIQMRPFIYDSQSHGRRISLWTEFDDTYINRVEEILMPDIRLRRAVRLEFCRWEFEREERRAAAVRAKRKAARQRAAQRRAAEQRAAEQRAAELAASRNLKCRHCPRSSRRFAYNGLLQHSQAKHDLYDLRRGRDYIVCKN